MSRIGLIGISQLEIIALKTLLSNDFGVEVAVYSSFDALTHDAEQPEGFIVSSTVFAGNIDFFMPRKSVTLVVSRGIKPSGDSKGKEQSIKVLYSNTSYSSIVENIRDLVTAIDYKPDQSHDLSTREIDVLKELASGKTNKEIAEKLFISVNTVITHRKNISAKLGIKSASGLSLYALMNGII